MRKFDAEFRDADHLAHHHPAQHQRQRRAQVNRQKPHAARRATAIEFNLQFRNTGVCELIVGSGATRLLSFNTLPHLDRAHRRESITFA